MKKILILCNHEIVLYNFKKELVEKIAEDFDTTISMPFKSSLIYFQDELSCTCIETTIDRRGINPITDIKLLFHYSRMIRKIRPDVIFTLTIKPTIYGGILSRRYHIPLITNITGIGTTFQKNNLLKWLIVKLYKSSLKYCKICFFENQENKDTFIVNNIVSDAQCKTVNGAGVNLKEFLYSDVFHEKLIIGFVGRVMREKGVEEYFKCIEMLNNPEIEFRVYGFCEDDFTYRLKELEKNYRFKYMGFCDDRQKIYSDIDCLVLPSYHEGMSNVLLEAAACGKIIITTDISGCRETVINGISGYTVQPGDSMDLLKAIKQVIALTMDQKIEIGKNARCHIESSFDRDEIVKEYMEEIQKQVNNNG